MSMLRAVTLICAAMLSLSASMGIARGQMEKPNQWAMDNALIGPDSPIEVPAGGTYHAKVMYPVPDGPLFPPNADVTWWIEPAVKGILVEAKSGAITVASTVPRGTLALLHADVAGRKEKLHAKLYVYSPKVDPLVGSWKVDSTQACKPGSKGAPVAQRTTGNDLDWKFHVDRQFWIGRELGMQAGVQQYGGYEYNRAHSVLKLTPKWPARQSESRWKVSLDQAGDTMQLTSRPEHHGESSACSYMLHRMARGN